VTSPRQVREAAGATLREVADAIGVSGNTVSRWERGCKQPSPAHAIEWERVTGYLARRARPRDAALGEPPEAVTATFSRRLREARRQRGVTLERLAMAAGIAQATLSRAEKGGGITLETAAALAGVLGVSLDDLIRDPEPGEGP
jgi:transcriptional regulator with XRE-family HTH domain